jgi:hypothetical protein
MEPPGVSASTRDRLRRRKMLRPAIAVALGVIIVILIVATSYHSATVGLTVANNMTSPVHIVMSVNGVTVFNQTLDPGGSWFSHLTVDWVAPVDPTSCETVPIIVLTNTAIPYANSTAELCSGQTDRASYLAGG